MHFQEVVTRFWKEHEEDPDAIMTSLSITLPPVEESAPAMTDKSQPEVTQPRQSDDSPETRSDAAGGRPIAATQSALDVFTSSPLTITDFVRYQGASGDFNPIHHDVDFARRGGYDGPFAVGMLTAGVAAARFNELRDPRDLRGLRMRWQAPAWPGDELTYVLTAATDGLQCAVTRFNPETAARREAHMTAWATYA